MDDELKRRELFKGNPLFDKIDTNIDAAKAKDPASFDKGIEEYIKQQGGHDAIARRAWRN